MTAPNVCKGCRYAMTWADTKRQFARALSRGLTVEQAKEASPRCQKCMTSLIRLMNSSVATEGPTCQ